MTMLACCGNDCGSCPRYLATMSGDLGRLKAVAAIWERVGWRDASAPLDDLKCRGCATIDWCRYGIRECAIAKGIDHCGQCGDYACDLLNDSFRRTDSYAEVCLEICSKEDYDLLRRVFFMKKESLARARRDHLSSTGAISPD